MSSTNPATYAYHSKVITKLHEAVTAVKAKPAWTRDDLENALMQWREEHKSVRHAFHETCLAFHAIEFKSQTVHGKAGLNKVLTKAIRVDMDCLVACALEACCNAAASLSAVIAAQRICGFDDADEDVSPAKCKLIKAAEEFAKPHADKPKAKRQRV